MESEESQPQTHSLGALWLCMLWAVALVELIVFSLSLDRPLQHPLRTANALKILSSAYSVALVTSF